MAQATVICSDVDLGVTEDGTEIHMVLNPDDAGLAAKAGQIRATLLKVESTKVGTECVNTRVYDPCKGCTVVLSNHVDIYEWCYTLNYEDDETVPPATLITQTHVEKLAVVTPVDEYQNQCISELSPGGGSADIYKITECGADDTQGITKLSFTDGDSNPQKFDENGSYTVNQDTTGLGVTNALVAVKPSTVTVGEFELALADSLDNIACEVAVILSDTQLKLIRGFQDLGFTHGLTVHATYVLSNTVPGGLVDQSTIADPSSYSIYQEILKPLSTQCIDAKCDKHPELYTPSCCDNMVIIDGVTNAEDADLNDALTLALTVGAPVFVAQEAANASGYKLAVAEDGVIHFANPLDLDNDGIADHFTVTLNNCVSSGTLVPNTSYVVAPQSQVTITPALAGTVVAESTLVGGDAMVWVGNTDANGCLSINITNQTLVPIEN